MAKNIEEKLREEAKRLLAEKKVDVIVGYEKGTLPLCSTPCFVSNPEDTDRLVWDFFCRQNLAKYVHDLLFQHKESQRNVKPEKRTKKVIGVVARGCASRSLIIQLQERQYHRDEVVIIGIPCTGYVAREKIDADADGEEILKGRVESDRIVVETVRGVKEIPLRNVIADNCLTCRFNNPIVSDMMIAVDAQPMSPDQEYDQVDEFEKQTVEERWAYFTGEMSKCIRCYACRNVCPSCYCKVCFVEQSQPGWVGIGIDETDTQVFQIMRIFHMAGRCVDCGACAEVCPMGVDLRRFLKKLDKDGFDLFNHRAGSVLDEPSPLSTFRDTDNEEFIFEPE